MNLFNYIGKIGNAVTALEPGISEADVQSLIGSGLGLMRGDDDPAIGHAKVMSRKTFTASCNQVMSAESTATHCEFAPGHERRSLLGHWPAHYTSVRSQMSIVRDKLTIGLIIGAV
ncbi:MAG: hypothetical protein ABSA13_19575 [Beijerinckiaceae bacterium]|jgi:hypothetical protein